MEQSLIERYLAGENSPQEIQQLRQLLEAKPSAERSVEEQALLLMLTGIRQEADDDLFCADYSDEYDKVVRRNTLHKVGKTAVTTIAIAACVIAIWFIGSWENKPHEIREAVRKQPQVTSPVVEETTPADSGSTITAPRPEVPTKEHIGPEANHYAWAKALMESYKEDDLGEISETTDNTPREDRDWAQK